jgi:hypothetical protein
MAHFANIEDGIVTQVVVVDNEHEDSGQEYLNSLGLPGTWIQTSYNANFRKKFASIGDSYDQEQDVFIPPKPFESWIWDENGWVWNPPVEYPNDDNFYIWHEQTTSWILAGE